MNTERKVAVVTGASRGLGEGIVNAFRQHGYRVVGTSRSIEPSDNPDYLTVAGDIGDPAVGKKVIEAALSRFGRPETAAGWHFLTGKEEAVRAVASAANFRYSFDEKHNLFAHASGIMLLTPDGRISRYFYGVEYPSRDVRLGLVDASAGKIGTPIDHLLLFCFQYNPETARYSATVLKIVRLGGILTILTIVGGILIFRRRDVRAASATSRPPLHGGSQQGAN